MKDILSKWDKALKATLTQLSHKELLADRGFLVYVTRTYPAMIPYLKGFHLTIEMWRGGRDSDGWKLKDANDDWLDNEERINTPGIDHAPRDGFTRAAP
jgi:hypothetical protein